jgi:hypothetical protein
MNPVHFNSILRVDLVKWSLHVRFLNWIYTYTLDNYLYFYFILHRNSQNYNFSFNFINIIWEYPSCLFYLLGLRFVWMIKAYSTNYIESSQLILQSQTRHKGHDRWHTVSKTDWLWVGPPAIFIILFIVMCVQTNSGTHPASDTMGTGSLFLGGKVAGVWR